MVSKLRKLNRALEELGQASYSLKLDITKHVDTLKAVGNQATFALNQNVVVHYYAARPLVLDYVVYDEKDSAAQPTVVENEFLKATVPGPIKTKAFQPSAYVRTPTTDTIATIGGQIEVTSEFVDKAFDDILTILKERYRKEIMDKLVNTRLKDAGLV